MLRVKQLIAFGFLPLLLYPYWFGLVSLHNTILGNKAILMWLSYDSKRSFFYSFLNDWMAALPESYLLVFALIFPSYLIAKIKKQTFILWFLGLVILESLILGWYFFGVNIDAISIVISLALLLCLTLMILMSVFENRLSKQRPQLL